MYKSVVVAVHLAVYVVYPYSSMLLLVSYQYNAAITTQTAERWTTKRCIYKNLHIMATMRSN